MRDFIKQEQFELEVLDKMNSARMLKGLVFGGGTMLRLCYGLNRFSVDLDFWAVSRRESGELFDNLKSLFSSEYSLTDAADKFATLLFEFRSGDYPRALKVEIRKEVKKITAERSIAFSKYSNTQVLLNTVSLKDMMTAKIEALIDREEIRDAFDIEFMVKKGVPVEAAPEIGKRLQAVIGSFRKTDYTSKLGSLLEASERKYYSSGNFKILLSALQSSP